MYIINRKSWHYRLASWSNPDIFAETNLCPYIRAVTLGLVGAIIVSGLAIFWIGVNILGIVDAFNGEWLDGNKPTLGAWGNIFTVFIGGIILFQEIVDRLETLYYRRKYALRFNHSDDAVQTVTPSQPGFLSVWWQSFRNKMCMEIKVE